MRLAFIGVVLVGLVVTVGCKSPSAQQGTTTTQASTSDNAKPTTVVMAINLGEEDERADAVT